MNATYHSNHHCVLNLLVVGYNRVGRELIVRMTQYNIEDSTHIIRSKSPKVVNEIIRSSWEVLSEYGDSVEIRVQNDSKDINELSLEPFSVVNTSSDYRQNDEVITLSAALPKASPTIDHLLNSSDKESLPFVDLAVLKNQKWIFYVGIGKTDTVAWLNLSDSSPAVSKLRQKLSTIGGMVCRQSTVGLWQDDSSWYQVRGCYLLTYDTTLDLRQMSKEKIDREITQYSYDLASLETIVIDANSQKLHLSWGDYHSRSKLHTVFNRLIGHVLPKPPTEITIQNNKIFRDVSNYIQHFAVGVD